MRRGGSAGVGGRGGSRWVGGGGYLGPGPTTWLAKKSPKFKPQIRTPNTRQQEPKWGAKCVPKSKKLGSKRCPRTNLKKIENMHRTWCLWTLENQAFASEGFNFALNLQLPKHHQKRYPNGSQNGVKIDCKSVSGRFPKRCPKTISKYNEHVSPRAPPRTPKIERQNRKNVVFFISGLKIAAHWRVLDRILS